MKKRNIILSILLTLCMFSSFFSATAYAVGPYNPAASLAFDGTYSGAVGEDVVITAVCKSAQAPEECVWGCDKGDAIMFSQTSILGPAETKEENTYWVSTMVTGVEEGSYEISLTIRNISSDTNLHGYYPPLRATVTFTVTPAISSRYTVLVLDASGSVAGTPFAEEKKAAKKFCQSVLASAGENHIAIVTLADPSSVYCNFTDDIDTLTQRVDSFSLVGGTNTNHALEIAGNLLDGISDENKSLEKNIVLCSDGLPEHGSSMESGPYNSSDRCYDRANMCYNTAEKLKKDGYVIYTLGFFHSLSGSDLEFGRRFMSDIANDGCYYEVTKAEELEFTFGNIADDITAEPITILLSEDEDENLKNRFIITAKVTNNNKDIELSNVYADIDEGDHADIISGEWKQSIDALGPDGSAEFAWTVDIDPAEYLDGGAHHYIVYAGSDQTVMSSAQGSIGIEATNKKDNELNFTYDVWGFKNFAEPKIDPDSEDEDAPREPHPMTEADKHVLLSNCSASEKAMLGQKIEDGSKGHCFGMALTAILSKMGIFNISEYDSGAIELRGAELTDRVRSILCYYQISQSLSGFKHDVQSFMEEPQKTQLELLSKRANAVKSGGCPVLFRFVCGEWFNHAVVGYALEPGSWTWDGKAYNRRILIYDCNSASFNNSVASFLVDPIWDESHCLYFNEGTDEWIIPCYKTIEDKITKEEKQGMVSTNPDAYFYQACSNINILDTGNYKSGVYNYAAELRCKNETAMLLQSGGKQYIIMGKSGKVSGDTELVTYHDAEAMPAEGGNIGDLHIVLPESSDGHSISTLSGDPEGLDFYLDSPGHAIIIKASKATGVRFNPDGSFVLEGNEGSFTLTVADDSIPEGKFNTYTFIGDNEGDISISLIDANVIVRGDDLEGLIIRAEEDDVTSTIELEDSTSEIKASRKEYDLVLEGDHVYTYKVKIEFDPNGGSGSMKDVFADKNSGYILPHCRFKAPEGMEFDRWDKGYIGEELTVTDDIVIRAQWKDKTMTPFEPEESAEPDKTSPKTGDNSNIFLWMMLGALSLAGVLCILPSVSKKRKR